VSICSLLLSTMLIMRDGVRKVLTGGNMFYNKHNLQIPERVRVAISAIYVQPIAASRCNRAWSSAFVYTLVHACGLVPFRACIWNGGVRLPLLDAWWVLSVAGMQQIIAVMRRWRTLDQGKMSPPPPSPLDRDSIDQRDGAILLYHASITSVHHCRRVVPARNHHVPGRSTETLRYVLLRYKQQVGNNVGVEEGHS